MKTDDTKNEEIKSTITFNWDKILVRSGIGMMILFVIALIFKAKFLIVFAELLGAVFFITLFCVIVVSISKKYNIISDKKDKK